jgi:hypothetical protein
MAPLRRMSALKLRAARRGIVAKRVALSILPHATDSPKISFLRRGYFGRTGAGDPCGLIHCQTYQSLSSSSGGIRAPARFNGK